MKFKRKSVIMKIFKRTEFLYNQYVCTAAKIAYRKIFKKKLKFRGIRGGKKVF